MAETIAANRLTDDIVISGEKDVINNYMIIQFSDAATIKAGDMVQFSTTNANDVIICGTGGVPILGVALDYANEADKKASYSLGVTIPDGKLVKVLKKTAGRVKIQCVLRRTATVSTLVRVGDPIYISETAAGAVSSVVPTTANLEIQRFVGFSESNVAVSVVTDKVILVRF